MGEEDPASQHRKYLRSLPAEERMLLKLRQELYSDSWEKMKLDLSDRLRGRPYIFKLANRIKEDISRIEILELYEKKHGINLADFLGEGGE